jgi:hypothetical protein
MSSSPRCIRSGGFVVYGGGIVAPWELFPDDLITAAEAAEIAGVSECAIRQWATRKKIKRYPGRRRCEPTLYARPEIEAEAERRAGRVPLAA